MDHGCTLLYSAHRQPTEEFWGFPSDKLDLQLFELQDAGHMGACKLAHFRLRRHFANNWCDKPPNINTAN